MSVRHLVVFSGPQGQGSSARWPKWIATMRSDAARGRFSQALSCKRITWTRTPDLYRVNFEVTPLKPFSSLAFPVFAVRKTPQSGPSFGDELVTSFLVVRYKNSQLENKADSLGQPRCFGEPKQRSAKCASD